MGENQMLFAWHAMCVDLEGFNDLCNLQPPLLSVLQRQAHAMYGMQLCCNGAAPTRLPSAYQSALAGDLLRQLLLQ